jgi:serine/threonine protein kinase
MVSLVVESSELRFGPMIGKGQFSKVFQGTFRNQEVAIKVLDQSTRPDPEQLERLKKELAVLSSLRSQNVVYFFGAVLKPKVCIVMEYCKVTARIDHIQLTL